MKVAIEKKYITKRGRKRRFIASFCQKLFKWEDNGMTTLNAEKTKYRWKNPSSSKNSKLTESVLEMKVRKNRFFSQGNKSWENLLPEGLHLKTIIGGSSGKRKIIPSKNMVLNKELKNSRNS